MYLKNKSSFFSLTFFFFFFRKPLTKSDVVVVVQSLSHVQLCIPRLYSMPDSPALHCFLEFPQRCVLWVSDAISSSAAPFYICLQSFPASRSFPVSRLFTSSRQSIGASASASVLLLLNIQDEWIFRVDVL